MAWDTLNGSPSGSNNLDQYNNGPATLLHELFHHLGLKHTFGATCNDEDDVFDTPTALGEYIHALTHVPPRGVIWGFSCVDGSER